MLLKGFKVAETAVFVDEGVLVIIAAVLLSILGGSSYQAGGRDVFHIDLDLLTGIACGFILLGNVLWIETIPEFV